MTNAKEEFVSLLKGGKEVLCASITYQPDYDEQYTFELPCGWDQDCMETFLENLNFEYDDGYGGQELFGTVWFTDDTWAEREEYDGSEWWVIRQEPTIPDHLLSK